MRTKVYFSLLAAVLSGTLAVSPIVRGQGKAYTNKMVELLDTGQTVFGTFVGNTTPDGAIQLSADPRLDFVFYDLEHSVFDVSQMRIFMQFLQSPAATLRRGNPGSDHPIIVRIPAYGREMNQWMVKNILDQGAYGVVVPHIENSEQALNVIRSMRYPHRRTDPDFEPEGFRGAAPGNASRFWGLSVPEYQRKADLWPLDPDGNMISWLLIENGPGVENAREIARVPGLSVLSPAPGDLGSYHNGDMEAVERDVGTVLAACKEFDVVCAITAGPADVEKRIEEGFRVIITSGDALDIGRRATAR